MLFSRCMFIHSIFEFWEDIFIGALVGSQRCGLMISKTRIDQSTIQDIDNIWIGNCIKLLKKNVKDFVFGYLGKVGCQSVMPLKLYLIPLHKIKFYCQNCQSPSLIS